MVYHENGQFDHYGRIFIAGVNFQVNKKILKSGKRFSQGQLKVDTE